MRPDPPTPTVLVVRAPARVVVHISGELDLASRDLLQERCDQVDTGGLDLLIDLTKLAYVDCGSLRILAGLIDACADRGGHASVLTPDGPVRRILEASGFADAYDVVPPAPRTAGCRTRAPRVTDLRVLRRDR